MGVCAIAAIDSVRARLSAKRINLISPLVQKKPLGSLGPPLSCPSLSTTLHIHFSSDQPMSHTDPDKDDFHNRDDSLELERLDHTRVHRYQIDPLSDSEGEDEHHTLTGGKESLLKHLHPDDLPHPATSTAHPNRTPPREDDTDTIDIHIIPLTSSEAIDRQRGDLQKNVTFSNGLTLVVGIIIGSGIFASPGPVFAYSKSVGVSLIIWFISGLLAFAGALCYAELGSAMPSSGGGEHAYLNHAFGSLPAFLFSWSSIALLKVNGPGIETNGHCSERAKSCKKKFQGGGSVDHLR
jgi:hypothetical protein